MGIQPVEKADAENIEQAMVNIMEKEAGLERSEWLDKTVAFASDGAAVMTGRKTGVVTRLKAGRPEIIGVHCFPHRLELAFKDAIKDVSLHKKVEGFLLSLYLFYHNSPLNRGNLKRSFKCLGMRSKLPSRVGGTRWVGHTLTALHIFLEGYNAFLQHFQQVCYK